MRSHDGRAWTVAPCPAALPTLLVEADPTVALRHVARFADAGILDVDIVETIAEAMRCVGEREYCILVAGSSAEGPGMQALFFDLAAAVAGPDRPAMLVSGGDGAGPLPAHATWFSQDADQAAFVEALRTAIDSSSAHCKSAHFCRTRACPLGAA